ncbi:MAG: LysR family transcriptional regulator [Chloroflexi bacterium]|nr:LysR family transcriptional regulator [Chloroflexota bacterium]
MDRFVYDIVISRTILMAYRYPRGAHPMELRQLRYFKAVARHGTYVAAAASLAVAQPALWRQVHDLERELGLALFEKVGRRVRLTIDGQTILEQAIDALDTVDRLDATAADLRSARAGIVAIACAGPHLQRFLAPVIGTFRRSRPDVVIRIREYSGGPGPGRGIREDLVDGIVDVATGTPTGADPMFDGFPVYGVRLIAAVPDAHALRAAATIDVEDLRDRPLVLSQAVSFSRGALEAACRRAGFEPRVAFDSASPASIMALGAAGLGLPIFVDDAVPPPAGEPWPVILEAGRPIGASVSLLWRAGAALSPTVRAFIDLARASVDQRQVSTSA